MRSNPLIPLQPKSVYTSILAVAVALLAFHGNAVLAQTIESYTFTTNRALPDGNAAGLSDVRTVDSAISQITTISARLKLAGEFNGDVYAYLSHSNGFTVLLNRVGRTTANPAGYADGGFDVTFQSDALNGDIHLYQDVTMPNAGQPLTGFWQPDGRSTDPASVTETSPRTSSLTNFVGLDATGEWTLYLVDLESGGTNQLQEWGLEITGVATPSLHWSTPSSITYGTALSATQLNASVTYYGTNIPGTFTYQPTAGTVLNAGNGQVLTVNFTPDDTNTFFPVSATVPIDVSPTVVTVTVADASKAFGAVLPTFTAQYSGFVTGDETNSFTAPATLHTTATATSDVGQYAITASGAVSSNYTFQYIGGTLTITQALTSLSVASSQNPVATGASVTFSADVSAIAPGAGSPTGTVVFRIDGTVAATATLSAGHVEFSTTSLSHGSHTITAEYAGEPNFVGSTNSLANPQSINCAPVATDDTIERYPNQGVKVRLATLLGNDTDGDHDTLSIIVSSVSALGGTVSVSGEWVFFTPAVGSTNADSFTYTLADGFGGSATGTVQVNLLIDNDPGQNLTIAAAGNGSVTIRGNGIPGRTYHLEYSDTIAPFNWQPLPNASVTANTNGVFEWVDSGLTGSRFYRSVYR